MKLIESPIQHNVNFATSFPLLAKTLFNRQAINYYKTYAVDSTQVVLVDNFEKVTLILTNTKRKIKPAEIDLVLEKILATTKDNVTIRPIDTKTLAVNDPKAEKLSDLVVIEKK